MAGLGYIKIHRSMLDWEWYQDDRCVRLLLHLHLKANYSPGRWKGREVEAGQLVTSSVQLALQLGWSRSAVIRTLDKLKECGESDTTSDNKWTLITLRKWDKFQGVPEKPDSKRASNRTATGQQTREQPDTIEEREEGKKEKKVEDATASLFPLVKVGKTLFAKCQYSDVARASQCLPELVAEGVDLKHYADAIRNWSDANDMKRTDVGWLATFRQWTKTDRDKGTLRKLAVATPWNPRA